MSQPQYQIASLRVPKSWLKGRERAWLWNASLRPSLTLLTLQVQQVTVVHQNGGSLLQVRRVYSNNCSRSGLHCHCKPTGLLSQCTRGVMLNYPLPLSLPTRQLNNWNHPTLNTLELHPMLFHPVLSHPVYLHRIDWRPTQWGDHTHDHLWTVNVM